MRGITPPLLLPLLLLATAVCAPLCASATALQATVGGAGSDSSLPPPTLPVNIPRNITFPPMREANGSVLYRVLATTHDAPYPRPPYPVAPYLLRLRGSRRQVGYDYAALLFGETSETYASFMRTITKNDTKAASALGLFNDWLWDAFYLPHVPAEFVTELQGMRQWCAEHPSECGSVEYAPHVVSQRFYTLANMPADGKNIIAALLRELVGGGGDGLREMPRWLRNDLPYIASILENFIHRCDAFGVWGPRTFGGRLYTSRNLDFTKDTGINRFKLITIYHILGGDDDNDGSSRNRAVRAYATFGFSFGLGALAGQNDAGVTTSEMNLDNSEVTFSGVPFPLRLRYVLENAVDLQSAMTVWNATNNTNSFNFLIGSAADNAAFALETIFNFTAVFPADSPIERAATFNCSFPPHLVPSCREWTWNQTEGLVPIGAPLPHAVWRTNHGLNPQVMRTQEPLFNNTVFRYRLMHTLFAGYGDAGVLIDDEAAVRFVATLGTKGANYLTCEQPLTGDNILSVVYVPGERRAFVAWEAGAGPTWRPAACSPYLHLDLAPWFANP